MGGRDAAENSFACAVVVAWEPLLGGRSMNPDSLSGVNGYVMLAWMERVALTAQMENAILLAQRAEAMLAPAYPKANFVCEQRPDKDGTIRMSTDAAFRTMKERHRYGRAIIYHDQHQNKEDRIATLEPAIANGWLAFNEKHLPGEFWKQFRQFPTADHNDAPDAVQGCLPVPDNYNRPTASESRGCTQATKQCGTKSPVPNVIESRPIEIRFHFHQLERARRPAEGQARCRRQGAAAYDEGGSEERSRRRDGESGSGSSGRVLVGSAQFDEPAVGAVVVAEDGPFPRRGQDGLAAVVARGFDKWFQLFTPSWHGTHTGNDALPPGHRKSYIKDRP